MASSSVKQAAQHLVRQLWAERELLDVLLYKLTCAKLLLAADVRRYVAPALAEVEAVVERIRLAELHRAVAVSDVAAAIGVPMEQASLKLIVERVDEPEASILLDHREAFLELTQQIEAISGENRRTASQALDRIRKGIDALAGHDEPGSSTYSPPGRRKGSLAPPQRLDKVV